MAELTDKECVNATLSTTTVDTVTLTGKWRVVEVYNRDDALTGAMMWVTFNGEDPVAEAAGCYPVPPGTAFERSVTPNDITGSPEPIKVLGNGNDYTVAGVG